QRSTGICEQETPPGGGHQDLISNFDVHTSKLGGNGSMAEFSVRSDSVDVEQIMRQIRARIREKRGADYTEAELEKIASVKLETFLDPRGLRSDLVQQFRARVANEHTQDEFTEAML